MSIDHKIAIVNSSSFGQIFTDHTEQLEKIGTVDFVKVDSEIDGKSLAEKLQEYTMIISSVTPFFDKEFFDHTEDLYLISRHGIGYNNIDVDSAKEHGVVVSIVPPLIERDAVAENNVANLLNVIRQTSEAQEAVTSDNWEERSSFLGNSLSGKTVGVIGVGNIGSRLVEIMNYGFRADVLGYDPYKSSLYMESFGARKVEFEELLEKSDVICLAASLNEDNYHMLSTEEFSKMKDGVYLSNTARGALVNEDATIDALQSGKVKGFATDVLEVEPGRADHPYLDEYNVVVTPHTAAYTEECLEQMGQKCVNDCKDIVDGKLPGHSVQAVSSILKERRG